jgi:hypothetical protein
MVLWRLASRTGCGFVVTAAVVAGFDAQGQVSGPGSQGATKKSEVRIVLVDVIVTSGSGRLVGGLRKKDFQVAEDGRPQTISFFEEHKGAVTTTISLPPMPASFHQLSEGEEHRISQSASAGFAEHTGA